MADASLIEIDSQILEMYFRSWRQAKFYAHHEETGAMHGGHKGSYMCDCMSCDSCRLDPKFLQLDDIATLRSTVFATS